MSIVDTLISLIILTFLEIVLGIDNLVFIAISSSKLPLEKQKKARKFGLALAWITRLLLLASAVWLASLTKPLFTLFDFAISARDLVLFFGGLFLLVKATLAIHEEIEHKQHEVTAKSPHSFTFVIVQIAILDIIFSLDSVITAVGLTNNFWIMAIAITIAIIAMILASEPLSKFINDHPTIKILAMSFLLLIGVMLVADGLHFHIPRGYIYFAVIFSLIIEVLNTVVRGKKHH